MVIKRFYFFFRYAKAKILIATTCNGAAFLTKCSHGNQFSSVEGGAVRGGLMCKRVLRIWHSFGGWVPSRIAGHFYHPLPHPIPAHHAQRAGD